MPATLPNFLIIGAQKAGTTSLAYHLKAHPEVSMASGMKEVRYFDLRYENGIDWYKEQFANWQGQAAVGEATPTYMAFEEVPARMAAAIPQARLIAILRDPVDRAYSHYWHNRTHNRETLDFADALAAEAKRTANADDTERRYRNHSYLARGRYLEQLLRVCQYYPREALQVLLFEDLTNAPLETFQSACRFLGIKDTVVPPNLGVAFNRFGSLENRSGRMWNLAWRIPMLQRAMGKVNPETSSYPPLDPALRAELQRQFEQDNAALAAWLGCDLSHWNAQTVPAKQRRGASRVAPSR
jgi:hypothetical protein